MTDLSRIPTTAFGGVVERKHFMDFSIRPLWPGMPRISGEAFTVQMAKGDHLMMHCALYEAPPGSIIVAVGAGDDFAVAGGNVCKVAQRRGIRGFIVEGVVRDIAEIEDAQFPVLARGLCPVPGKKNAYIPLGQEISCGGARVRTGDLVVADEDGIVVLPHESAQESITMAQTKAEAEDAMTLNQWQENHEKIIHAKLAQLKKQ